MVFVVLSMVFIGLPVVLVRLAVVLPVGVFVFFVSLIFIVIGFVGGNAGVPTGLVREFETRDLLERILSRGPRKVDPCVSEPHRPSEENENGYDAPQREQCSPSA